jgi:hypothetical protein
VPRGRAAILSTEAKVSSSRFLSQQRDEGVEALAATAAAPMGAGAEKRLVDGIFLIGHFYLACTYGLMGNASDWLHG